jgi:hypothetical protein
MCWRPRPKVSSALPSPPPWLRWPSETREEALSMIREAIEVYIESLVATGATGAPGRQAMDGANPTLGQPPFPQQAGFSSRPCPTAPIVNFFESSA